MRGTAAVAEHRVERAPAGAQRQHVLGGVLALIEQVGVDLDELGVIVPAQRFVGRDVHRQRRGRRAPRFCTVALRSSGR